MFASLESLSWDGMGFCRGCNEVGDRQASFGDGSVKGEVMGHAAQRQVGDREGSMCR